MEFLCDNSYKILKKLSVKNEKSFIKNYVKNFEVVVTFSCPISQKLQNGYKIFFSFYHAEIALNTPSV